ncbi:amino acid transporter [Rhodococcus rhodnii]|uniref:Lysine exporter protein n=2 Tax=Rhodococcus rhodnii TaxID=38312 RepID=R7WSG5_9NOCA|nr:LysE/ArgO family amino acid transporter [Rhodococcus rhodnii]EOM76904.1 lysine exporter protein [Rhodococcus rhodnii LMG 5362]TXG89739.1 amino acid transporter [Rhodococcus rhodnii]
MPLLSSASLLAAGFGTGISLIAAIGAQNAFVLRQGVLRRNVGTVVAVCVVSDLVLIVAGVAGISALLSRAPGAIDVVRFAGAAFLLAYGLFAARRALWPSGDALTPSDSSARSGWAVLATCLALTWLNPHTYLDIVMLGSIGTRHGDGRWLFAAGAIVASIVWFTVLGFGARRLGAVLATPRAWRVLDAAVATLMIVLAVGLVASTPGGGAAVASLAP